MANYGQSFLARSSDFKPGDLVRYVPGHAHGDVAHKDCEDGVVTSTNEELVFVRYGAGGAGQISKATYPDDLWKLE